MIRIGWANETAAAGTFPFGGLGYTRNVPVFFVIITDPRFSKISGQNSTSIPIIQRQNVGHLVQNMWLMIHSLGLVSVITMIRHVENEIKECFGIPSELEVTQVLPVGYPRQFRAKSRRPLQSFVHYDRSDASKLRTEELIEEIISNPK